MPLSSEQIARIRDRLPGWEEDWGELCVLLLGADGESGILYRAARSLHVGWPSAVECDDFVAERLLDYQNRAVRGTLLLSYDLERGCDVVSFLTTHNVLRVEANKFLSKLAIRQLSLDDPKCSPDLEPKAKPLQDTVFSGLISSVQEGLQRIRLPGTKRITRVHEQAALQLYSRLDWSQPEMDLFREHLLRVLCAPSHDADSLAGLTQEHQTADRFFQKRLERLSAKIHNHGKGVSVARREFLERRYGDLRFQQVFLPLDANAIVRLLGIKPADAAQRRHRYRAELPSLLPGLSTYYEDLRQHRSEVSKGGAGEA